MAKAKKPDPEKPKPGPAADRLVIQPEKLEAGLDRLLGKGAPPLDQRKKKPKGKR